MSAADKTEPVPWPLSEMGRETEVRKEYLLFRTGTRFWSIPTDILVQAFYLDNITPIPLTPTIILGLTNIRGVALPVLDIGALFGKPTVIWRAKGKRSLLVQTEEYGFCILADEIGAIVSVADESKTTMDSEISCHAFVVDDIPRVELDAEKLVHLIRVITRREIKKSGIAT